MKVGTTNIRPFRTTVAGINAVAFYGGRLQSNITASSFLSGASVWAGSDWTIETWVQHNGTDMTTSAEVPIFQWGRRSGPSSGVCNGAYLSVGSQPSYGAGGFFGSGCDVSYGATNTTEIGVGGSRPRINEWHHVVLTYTGIQPQPNMGVQANTWTLYVDGVVSRQGSNILNILRGDIGGDMMTVGSYIGTTGAWGITTTGLLIGQIRMHEQMLGPDDVAFNYALDAPLYRPGAASTASGVQLIPTPSSSPSPGAGSCPAAWSGVTHFLRGLSLQSANDTTGYMRHGECLSTTTGCCSPHPHLSFLKNCFLIPRPTHLSVTPQHATICMSRRPSQLRI